MPSIYGVDPETEATLRLAIENEDADLLKKTAEKAGNIGSVTVTFPEKVRDWIVEVLTEGMIPWEKSITASSIHYG